MYELALFAGTGGGLLASHWLLGWNAVCYVERDPYCIGVLQQRISDGLLSDAPIWDDVQSFDGRPWAGCVDIITAGFPCQPYSGAGKRAGHLDQRNLWPDTVRIIGEVQPEWVLLENVARLLTYDYVGEIFSDLATGGYDLRWDCIPAAAVGAPHIRDRVWIVGHAHSGRRQQCDTLQRGFREPDTRSTDVPHADVRRCEIAAHVAPGAGIVRSGADVAGSGLGQSAWWETEPALGRVADGVADRVGQLRAIGNGQVPRVVECVWENLTQRVGQVG